MSNYYISQKLIKKLKDDYLIDYEAFLSFLEAYYPSQFSTKYLYPKITKDENKHVIDLSEIVKFNFEDLDVIFKNDTDLKLNIYKIMQLISQLKRFNVKEMNDVARANNLKNMNQRVYKDMLKINVTLAIVPAKDVLKWFKKDKIYQYLNTNEKKEIYKNVYDYLATAFEKADIECSSEHIKTLNKDDFDSLMSLFDMIDI